MGWWAGCGVTTVAAWQFQPPAVMDTDHVFDMQVLSRSACRARMQHPPAPLPPLFSPAPLL